MEDDAILTPLPIDDEISSLLAILLNEAYYELLKKGQIIVDNIPVLSPTCLISFKAKDKQKMTDMLYQCYGLKNKRNRLSYLHFIGLDKQDLRGKLL